jgi:radical SAM protein with 4Fe4S-binding SPASM domain
MNDLYLLAVNLTRRCNLACAHCYLDATTLRDGAPDELTTVEVCALLDEVADRSNETMVVLTGGEPLLRPDLVELVAHGSGLGLAMVVGTNGTLLDADRVAALKTAGALGVGISVDSLDPALHDGFRGRPGSWQKTLDGIEACRRQGLPFQVHFSVTAANAGELPAMIDFARSSGARVLNLFFLVCTGRGESMTDISPEQYEQVLEQIVRAQQQSDDLLIRARCAPHFKRVAYQVDPTLPLTRAQGYEGGGCLAGRHYCRVAPDGAVTACPYIAESEGSVREQPFWSIWDGSANFRALRNPQLGGKCGDCEFRMLCGGCRARPLARGDGLLDADPWCSYQPRGAAVIEPLADSPDSMVTWDPVAEQRLARVPPFLRKMVRKRAESHVLEQGETRVTPEHMQQLAKRRFGDAGPPRPEGEANAPVAGGLASALPWTPEAERHLGDLPPVLQGGIRTVAEDVAREEGRLEVNMQLLARLEEEDAPERRLPWVPDAEQALEHSLAGKPAQVRLFTAPTLEAAIEQVARQRGAGSVTAADVARVVVTDGTGVTWSDEARRRLATAPEFIRPGIKKAAEFNARREGLAVIGSDDLTRFRNRAMLRAVRRIKGFGMQSLDFDAFDIARERVPRLQGNAQAAERFASSRGYVESHQAEDGSGLGTLGHDLLERMRAELAPADRTAPTARTQPVESGDE